jgi:hypothetical protein
MPDPTRTRRLRDSIRFYSEAIRAFQRAREAIELRRGAATAPPRLAEIECRLSENSDAVQSLRKALAAAQAELDQELNGAVN